MNFVIMTAEEVQNVKFKNKNAKVLVAVSDLEQPDINAEFEVKRLYECEKLFRNAETVMSVCDDFMKSLRLFTEKQDNLFELKPKGSQGIILFRGKPLLPE